MKKKHSYILLAIIALSAFSRFYNLNWDQSHFFHPDERNLAMAVSKVNIPSQLKPDFYAYNNLPIYITDLLSQLISRLTQNPKWFHSWSHINLITRHLSAATSVLTVFVIYLICQRLFSIRIALTTSLWTASTVGFIQYAHYGVTESLLIFLLSIISYLSVLLYQKPRSPKLWLILSLIIGLSIATKTTAISFLIFPAVILLKSFIKHQSLSILPYSLLFLLLTTCFTLIFSPYSLLDYHNFKKSMTYEHNVVTGTLQVPYTTQFINTTPYWFQLKNLPWQLGPALAFIGPLALIAWLFQSLKKHRQSPFLPSLIFTITYFTYIGRWHTKFIRYMLPTLPFLITSTAWLLHQLVHHKKKYLVLTLFTIISLSSILWSSAYLNIYQQPQTRLQASTWIYQNIPSKSNILVEEWDDHLPISLDNHQSNYQKHVLKIFSRDQNSKIQQLTKKLALGDYLIIASRRTYKAIQSAPHKFPLTTRYYQLLFSQKLGYQLVTTFSTFPKIGPLTFSTSSSEESFQIYDHPKIIIFKNTNHFTPQKLQQLIL